MKKILIALVLSLALILPFTASAQTIGDKPILYVREGCPHCTKVKAFLDKYNLNDQVVLVETFNNETTTKEMEAWFVKLNVTDPNQKGVPFLVLSDTKYLVGDVPIIEEFAKRNNITIDVNEYQSSTTDTIFLFVGGLILFGVMGYGIFSSFKKKS